MSTIDIDHLKQWEGKQESREELISLAAARGMAATLDWEKQLNPGDELPQPWHWLYFFGAARASEIGHDGHPRRGGFFPPVTLPRRMWASGDAQFSAPLCIGDTARKVSTIQSVKHKQGGTGDLVFVTVGHEIFVDDRLCIQENQNIVYREDPDPKAPPPEPMAPPAEPEFTRQVIADPVLLFRYSALTFNSHRIHYDRDYAMNEEGYAGLVVHGPLSASLLVELVRAEFPEADIEHFEFRAVRPLLDGKPFRLEGCRNNEGLTLWVVDHEGAMTMQAKATLKN